MNKKNKNYLDFIPVRNPKINYTEDVNGIITLEVVRCGLFDKLVQFIFKVPKNSFIKLDKLGSCVWKSIDNQSCVYDLSKIIKSEFGKNCEPLYERLITYLNILKENKFISVKKSGRY